MENLNSKSFLVIEKVKRATGDQAPIDVREFVARVPFESGEHHTEHGILGVSLYPINDRNQLKMVLTGEIVPTIQKRGKKGQFKKVKESPRRVVDFPLISGGIVKHDFGSQEYLLFRREEVVYTAE